MRTTLLTLGLVAMVSASAQLAAPARSVAIGGTGRDACSDWLSDRSGTSASAQLASRGRVEWISGFLSGVNLFADKSGHLKGGVDDPDGVLVWIDTYCRAHPTDPQWAAAAALVLDLRNNPR